MTRYMDKDRRDWRAKLHRLIRRYRALLAVAVLLARLAARLETWVAELRDVAQVYGELTGDYLTPVQVKRGLEKMQVVVQANGENGGWE